MNNKQLFISEELVDLSADTVIAITKQIHDIGDISTRNSDRSNKFKIPKTSTNQHIFGVSDRVQSGSAKPYRKTNCKFVDNGVEIIPNGFAIINEADEFYSVTIYSGNLDFFSVIEELTLSDLDFSDLDHVFTMTAIEDSRTNTTGYKYPMIDYGSFPSGTREINCSDLRPAVFFSTILDKIFTDAGFTYSGDIFSEDKFTKLLFAFSANDFSTYYNNSEIELKENYFNMTGGFDPEETSNLVIEEGESWSMRLRIKYTVTAWTDGVSLLEFNLGGAPLSDFYVSYFHPDTIDGGGVGTFEIEFSVSGTETDPDEQVYVNFRGSNATVQILGGEWFGERTDNVDDNFNIHLKKDIVRVFGGVATTWSISTDLEFAFDFSTWDFAALLGEMTQTEFVKAIANMFCLFVETDEHTKNVSFTSFKDISDNRSVAKDWTDKIDMNSSKIEFRIGSYGRRNYLKYLVDAEDIDVIEGFADSYFEIDDETLPDEVTVVELPFAGTKMTTKLEGLKVPLIRKIDDDGNFTINTSPRVVYDNTSDISGGNITLNDTINTTSTSFSTDVPLAYFIDEAQMNNLGFNNSLLSDNYSEFQELFNRMKKVTARFNLNHVDITSFSHFIPVFIESHAAFFYVNKISNFKANELTTVELIRI